VSLHGREKIAGWKSLAARAAWREFVRALLTEHYDPAYRRSSLRNFTRLPQAERLSIRAAEDQAFDAAARELLDQSRVCSLH
jgi:tRNA 2-selenouridine synthase